MFLTICLTAQDIESITKNKKDILKINGSVSLGSWFYNATGIGKIMPTQVNVYLVNYLNGSFSYRKDENLSYHNILWYYERPSYDILTKKINNFKIPSIFNR